MTDDDIATLAVLAQRAGLSLLELDAGGAQVRLRFDADDARPAAAPPAETAEAVSPCVGRFVRSHPLGGEPVEEGDAVEKGAVLAYVRSGRLLTPVRSPREGRVVETLAAEGEGVGFGVALFRVAR